MAVASVQPPFTTRSRFRADLRTELEGAIKLATVPVGDVIGEAGDDLTAEEALAAADVVAKIPVVTVAALEEAVHGLFGRPLPPPSEREAEVRTNAILNIWARCPNCGIHLVIPLEVQPQLVLDDGGTGELKLKAKSKGRIHACNQLTLDEPEGQILAFARDAVDGSDVEDVSEDAEPEPATAASVRDLLGLLELDPAEYGVDAWDQVTLELVADYVRLTIAGAAIGGDGLEVPERPAVLDVRCASEGHVDGCGHRCGLAIDGGFPCELRPDHVGAHSDLPF